MPGLSTDMSEWELDDFYTIITWAQLQP